MTRESNLSECTFVFPPEAAGTARRRLHVKVSMTGGEVTGVQVGGASVVVGEGTMGV